MRRIALTIAALSLGTALAVGVLAAGAEGNLARVVVDFEGLPEGALVQNVQVGSGMSGSRVAGAVGVFGRRSSTPTVPAAMVFDATCEPGGTAAACTGGEAGLFFPDRGNLLIVSADGDPSDPDGADDGIVLFDFSRFGDGVVRVESLVVAGTGQRQARLSWLDANGRAGSVDLPATGDRLWRRVDLGLENIVALTVDLAGEGAVDDLVLVVPGPATGTTTTTSLPGTTTTTTTTIPGTTTTTIPGTTTTIPTTTGPSLTLRTGANGSPAGTPPGPRITPGDPITWTHTVTNNGDEDLWSLIVWHNGYGRATCATRTLRVGDTTTCTLTATADRDTYAAGVSATAWAADSTEASDAGTANYTTLPGTTTTTTIPGTTTTTTIPGTTTTTIPGTTTTIPGTTTTTTTTIPGTTTTIPTTPALELRILVNGTEAGTSPGPAVGRGSTVALEYRVTNVGDGNLWALWMWEPGYGRIDCPTRAVPEGGTVVCTRTVTAGTGITSSEALARAWDDVGVEVEDTAAYHYFATADSPSVDIEVFVEGFDADQPPGPRLKTPGEVIEFTYVVTNDGRTPLSGISVIDSRRGPVDCPASELAIGRAMVCFDTDITRWGNHAGIGTVSADAAGTPVQDSDPVHWHTRNEPRIHDLRLEVSVNGDPADAAPGPVIHIPGTARFSYTIENRGNTWMNEISIAHPGVLESSIRCDGDRTLWAGETLRCTANVAAVSGVYSEEVTVYAWDNDGRRATATDPVHYTGIQ